jgi:hypothetical protein
MNSFSDGETLTAGKLNTNFNTQKRLLKVCLTGQRVEPLLFTTMEMLLSMEKLVLSEAYSYLPE